MVNNITPAEIFSPGEFLKEELEARGWSQADLATILGRPPRLISEVISGKRAITPETAKGLGEALGTGAQFWLNLESAYRLSRLPDTDDDGVTRRARLFEKAPIKELISRGWIESSPDPEVLEAQLLELFGIESLAQAPTIWPHAARKSTSYDALTPAQLAWLCRARQLARTIDVGAFDDQDFDAAVCRLRALTSTVEGIPQVPRVLAKSGIRFLVVEPLASTKIDGACFWLDKNSPVVTLSLRFDRIDWFWHTLMHELGHVKAKDGLDNLATPLDIDLLGELPREDRPKSEKQADAFAVENLIPQEELSAFMKKTRPLYSRIKIESFARRLGIHPGIVVGQLQHRGEIQYSHSRALLVKVRSLVTGEALTDGWN